VGLNDDGSAAARRFHERVRNPLLTDIAIDWNGLAVSDVYPKAIPDLFAAKPVIVNGRYTGNGKGVIRLKGKMSGRDFVREIPVDFSSAQSHDVLATLWARTRIDDLMSQDFAGAQRGTMKDEVKQSIVQLGLDFRLMTQFTSFVAVEEMIVTDGGQPRRVDVPVEVPEGVNRQMVYGEGTWALRSSANNGRAFGRMPAGTAQATVGTRSGSVGLMPGGAGSGGVVAGGLANAPAAPPKASPVIMTEADSVSVLSLAEQKRTALQSTIHPSLLAVIERLKARNPIAGADEAKFIRNDKAEIQIWFVDKSDEAMAKLKELGFEVILDPKTAKMVIGRIPIEKLAALTEMKSIRYVAPQMRN